MHPSIITNPINQTNVVGNTTVYTCAATGYPQPNITWSGPGKGYTSNTVNTDMPLPTVYSQFTLVYLNWTNRGSYYCTAENDLIEKLSINSTVTTLSLQCTLV